MIKIIFRIKIVRFIYKASIKQEGSTNFKFEAFANTVSAVDQNNSEVVKRFFEQKFSHIKKCMRDTDRPVLMH